MRAVDEVFKSFLLGAQQKERGIRMHLLNPALFDLGLCTDNEMVTGASCDSQESGAPGTDRIIRLKSY